jgi:hypothetical protein
MASAIDLLPYQMLLLTERVKVLEENAPKKKKRKDTTRAQQMLLLKHSGLLDKILDYEITKKSKALFLSVLLNADPDNIEDDLSTIRQDISGLTTKSNYDFVIDTFEKASLENFKMESEKILKNLLKKG